jgi:DNA helicase HerA-like ATPase
VRSHEETLQIGWVAEVNSERVTVELDPSTTGLVKAGAAGVLPVGSINSYLVIAVGPHRVVAVVTALTMTPEAPRSRDPYDVSAAVERRLEATMVGRIDHSDFIPGLAGYPPLFAPVSVATRRDLAAIFHPGSGPVLRLGEAVVASDQDVVLDANMLLARHSAVLGSTGAGKSCTVTAILDELLRLDLPHANIIVFDSNGEYAAAFAPSTQRGKLANAVVIGPEPGPSSGLVVPHWFMNNEEHLAILRASDAVQAPLLQRALADARLGAGGHGSPLARLKVIRRSIDIVRALDGSPSRKPQPAIELQFRALEEQVSTYRDEADPADPMSGSWTQMAACAARWSELGLVRGNDAWDAQLTARQRQLFEEILAELDNQVRAGLNLLGLGSSAASSDFDAPNYYSLEELCDLYLPGRIELEAENEPRVTNYMATLLMRLSRLLADSRYDFLTRVDQHEGSLARYLRLLLGFDPLHELPDDVDVPWAAAYEQRSAAGSSTHAVTIIDLSMIAFDVLENVTALLARLILDFLQRVEPRGSLPVLLVLEEAHRYIPRVHGGDRSRSAVTFERIAKEGRKYGASLLVASQRPSELAETVLSQCGTLIAHRIVNQADQDIIRHATPFAGRDVLRQLPGLATQHAVVVGEAVRAPALVRIREVADTPKGNDPDFVKLWRDGPGYDVGEQIDAVAGAWERGERHVEDPVAPTASTEEAPENG